MATRALDLRLGTADLDGHRHVCGLFDGPDDAAAALDPFVLEALARGERVVHLVEDPERQLRRLGERADISAAIERGQLDVRPWNESYLSDRRFSASRMLSYVRRAMRESRSLAFPGTRLIGDMEWATERLPGVDELIDYERGLDAILARPRTTVICAYDARRHSGPTIAQVLGAHQAAVVDGRLQLVPSSGQGPSPRERILMAASLLFAENGVTATGVDALIEAAGVAKATFYRHFASKDSLVVAWLEDEGTRWFDGVRADAEAAATTPIEIVPRLFEAVAAWLEANDFIGCPYLNTSVEITDPASPASRAVRDYLGEIGQYFQDVVAASGREDAGLLGPSIHALMAGGISLGVANRSTAHILAARDLAAQLLRA